ncbi:MAG TPA: hypothetical protein EYP78_03715, partial [Candidatus Omnitrophica bacterium]|nr:hypothetical protein [Candidatus Omnitrophota bacterium]
NTEIIELAKLNPSEVPEQFRVEYYFDFKKHPFRYQQLFESAEVNSVVSVLDKIDSYAKEWLAKRITTSEKEGSINILTEGDFKGKSLGRFRVFIEDGVIFEPAFIQGSTAMDEMYTIYVAKGAQIFGANIFLNEGDIFIDEGSKVEPGVGIKGPTIIGKNNDIRQGAYFRGDIITGDGCTLRGELKNVVMMDEANFPHPSYVGDSICGYKTHFGNQATTANLGIYAIVLGKENVKIKLNEQIYDLGRPKIGIILGDYSQVGCNSVSDPGSFLAPYTIVYQLSRINKGFYGPQEVLKNKPLEKNVIERAPFKR